MRPFSVTRVDEVAGATAAVAERRNARWIAGGTTLVDLMKLDVESPALLVDISSLPIGRIEMLPGNGLRIGALAKMSAVAADENVLTHFPVIAQALLAGASPQLRNMATIGGNLMQRTRCSYFRNTHTRCNKREPGTGCDAFEGDTSGHAVLGVSELCIATHPGDLAVALVALEASVSTSAPNGQSRTIPVEELYVAYGDDPAREHVLEYGELITSVEIPGEPWFRRSHFLKVRTRSSYEFALAAAAVALDLDGTTIRNARVALGGVATRPWRSREAEEMLVGRTVDPIAFADAAEAALADAQPQADNAYKVELVRGTLERALAEAAKVQLR